MNSLSVEASVSHVSFSFRKMRHAFYRDAPGQARPGRAGPGPAGRVGNLPGRAGEWNGKIWISDAFFDFLKNQSKTCILYIFDPSRCENRVQHLKIIQNDLFKPNLDFTPSLTFWSIFYVLEAFSGHLGVAVLGFAGFRGSRAGPGRV